MIKLNIKIYPYAMHINVAIVWSRILININSIPMHIDEAESIEEGSVTRIFRSYGTILRHVCRIASNTVAKAAATLRDTRPLSVFRGHRKMKNRPSYSRLSLYKIPSPFALRRCEDHLDHGRERKKSFFGKFTLTAR